MTDLERMAMQPPQDGGKWHKDSRPCSDCGPLAHRLGTAKEIYPHRPDLHHKQVWFCECGAYVGCHPNTNNPLGSPAGLETRKARQAAHAAFDPLWKNKARKNARDKAYKWLAQALRIPEAHISWMDINQAREVIVACRRRVEQERLLK